MELIVTEIALKELKKKPQNILQILDKGVRNKVFKVTAHSTEYIFRLNSEKRALAMYQKEKWCMDKAREVGVPTSECLYVGMSGEYAYMILSYIEGVNGDDSQLDKRDIFRKLGEYAQVFNSVQTAGFGRDTVDPDMGFTQTWEEFHDATMNKVVDNPVLVESGVFSREQIGKIKTRLSEMKDWNYRPHLCHGNLGSNNTVVNPDGEIFVIDWGNGAGHLAPHVDLADIIAWNSTRIFLDDFLEGYGMSKDEFRKIEREVNDILILKLLDVMKWAISTDYEVLNRKFVDQSVERILKLV